MPLFSTTDSMFVRRGHPLLGKPVSPDALLDYPCVELTPDESRYHHIVEDMQPKKLARNRLHLAERVICSTNSMMSAVDMINDSDAILLAYPSCMAGYFADYGIEPLTLIQQGQRCTVGIYLMREKADAPHLMQMQALMQQHLEQIRPLLV